MNKFQKREECLKNKEEAKSLKHKNRIKYLKRKHNVDKIYSFSEVDSYIQDKYSFYLKRIARIDSDRTGADGYLLLGSIAHDLLEDYYNKEIPSKDMKDYFDNDFDNVRCIGSKFILGDDDKNDRAMNKYYECVYHFFENFNPLKGKTLVEKAISINVGGNIFNGYVDCINKGHFGKKVSIIDFKTSTMYTGSKIKAHGNQLILYALGLHQLKKIPIEDIQIGWNFIKYATVEIEQLNGKIKIGNWERCELGNKCLSYVKKWCKKLKYTDEQYEEFESEISISNSLQCLPEELLQKFKISDCYVWIDFNKEVIDDFISHYSNVVKNIEKDKKEFKKTNDDMIFYQEVESKDEYYYYNLCDYSSKIHKPFKDYMDKKELNNTKEEKDDFSIDLNERETTDVSIAKAIGADEIDFDELFDL